jgi:hypothetical protein
MVSRRPSSQSAEPVNFGLAMIEADELDPHLKHPSMTRERLNAIHPLPLGHVHQEAPRVLGEERLKRDRNGVALDLVALPVVGQIGVLRDRSPANRTEV